MVEINSLVMSIDTMKFVKRLYLALILVIANLSFSEAATVTSPSNFWDNPTRLDIEAGSNTITGISLGSSENFGAMFVTLYVTENVQITELNVLSYSSAPTNGGSFLGLQIGETLSASPEELLVNTDPINNILFNDGLIGTNLLPILAVGQPLGGDAILTEGSYALWFNETGAAADFTIEWVATAVPEPSSLVLLFLGASIFLRRTR